MTKLRFLFSGKIVEKSIILLAITINTYHFDIRANHIKVVYYTDFSYLAAKASVF